MKIDIPYDIGDPILLLSTGRSRAMEKSWHQDSASTSSTRKKENGS